MKDGNLRAFDSVDDSDDSFGDELEDDVMFDKKAYQREYMAKRRAKKLTAVPVLAEPDQSGLPGSESGEARESTSVTEAEPIGVAKHSRGGSQIISVGGWDYELPCGIEPREARHAIERTNRAKRYALAMPQFVSPGDMKYQGPLWQWENEVRGRFGGIIGGSLSGTRGGNT